MGRCQNRQHRARLRAIEPDGTNHHQTRWRRHQLRHRSIPQRASLKRLGPNRPHPPPRRENNSLRKRISNIARLPAPLIFRYNFEIPEDKLVKFYAISNEILDEAKNTEDNHGGGVIPLPWTISDDKFVKYDVKNYLMNMVQNYMKTILSNGNVQSNLNDIVPGGPHTQWNTRITDAWVVSQKENDYIPVHTHHNQKESCKISGVLYLKVPEQLEKPSTDTAIKGGKDGQIVFTGMGGADPFSTTVQFNLPPQVGWLYLFPSSLNHQVYPFKGEGERRGISFNIDVISKEQLELIEKFEKGQNETQ